jgi:hypothetical protein
MDVSLENLLNKVAKKNTSKSPDYGLRKLNTGVNLWSFTKDDSRQEFWMKYCELVARQNNEPGNSYNYFLSEVNSESSFMLEFNFRFLESEDLRRSEGPFDEEFICKTISCISKVMKANLNLSEEDKELICCVLQSRKFWSDTTPNEIKFNFRFQYPFCRTSVENQSKTSKLRKMIMEELNRSGPKLNETCDKKWIADENIPSKYVPLYGCRQKASEEPLELTHIFGYDETEDGLFHELNLDDVFDPRDHSDVQNGRIDEHIFDNKDINKWIPLFLSSIFCPRNCKMIQKQESDVHKSSSRSSVTEDTKAEKYDGPKTPMDFMKEFIKMLKPERRNDQTSWLDVGKAYYHATYGGLEGLEEWKRWTKGEVKDDISENSQNFDGMVNEDAPNFIGSDDMCDLKYHCFRDSLITFKTIAWHALHDSPIKYNVWHQEWVKASKEKALKEPLHSDIAEMFYRKYWLHFAFASNGKRGCGKTFRFDENGHRWKLLEDGDITIGKILTEEFLSEFESEKAEIDKNNPNKNRNSKQRNSKDNGEEENESELMYKNILKIISMLGSTPQKKCIIGGIQEKLFLEGFEKNLDTNPMLVGVLNGIIEVDTKDAIFRSGKPEDYISMCTSLPYRQDFTWECDSVKRYLRYLRQVFPDDKLLKYIRKDISSFLKGRNAEKLFRIFSGSGDNSKSVYVKLLERAFGSYCVSIPVQVITVKKGSSSNASPETARLRGAHIATMSEPDNDETIKAGTVKSMTGNDRFFVRALFSNGEEIEPMYKLILITNKVPAIPNSHKAIKNRVIIIPFLAQFVDKPYSMETPNGYPEDEDEQYRKRIFKKDPDFEDYVPLLAQAMLWCAVQDYRTYCSEGLKSLPDVIMNETSNYWIENDMYALFTREKLVKEVLPEPSEEVSDIVLDVSEGQREGQRDSKSESKSEVDVVLKSKTPKKTKESKYTTKVSTSELFKLAFKPWQKDVFPSTKAINQTDFILAMKEHIGEPKDGKWYGWSIKEEDQNKF